jgi:hypothetical protein
MIHYLRVLCESSIQGHHELAIGALHRIFYATTERLDPLPKLLSQWRSGVYSKKYLEQLMDLFVTTIRTLETARDVFVGSSTYEAQSATKTAKTAKGSKREMDLEQYTLSAMRFNVNDYFQRLCSTHTVNMIVRLLATLRDNTGFVNDKLFWLLQRLCQFRIENDSLAPSVHDSDGGALTISQQPIPQRDRVLPHTHLGFLLFSLPSLGIMNSLLNDDSLCVSEAHAPIVRLLKGVVRNFGELARENPLMYVEALFTPVRPHDVILQWNSVYDSALFAVGERHRERQRLAAAAAGLENDPQSSDDGSDGDNNNDINSGSSSSDESELSNKLQLVKSTRPDDEGDDEFDDSKLDDDLKRVRERRLREKEQALQDKKTIRMLKKHKNRRRRDEESESDDNLWNDDEVEGDNEDNDNNKPKKDMLPSTSEAQIDNSGRGTSRTRNRRGRQREWSAAEDTLLKSLFRLYAGSRSVFQSIASHPQFM